MFNRKFLNIVISIWVVTSLILGGTIQVNNVSAMPMDPMDQTKVPHYFGPWPNWALSPLTSPNATVEIQGNGSGATAVALVDPVTQGIASIQVTSPGSGYKTANVVIKGGNGNATAQATIVTSGAVTSVNVDTAGGGYTSPQVTFSGGGGTGVLVSVGNPLIDRAYATDFVSAPAVISAVASPAATRIFKVNAGSATGGTFTLTVDAATTAPIAWNAAALDVEGALTAAGISATVSGTGSIADPWVITFNVAPASVTIDGAGLTQAVADASAVAGSLPEIYNVNIGSATGGTFTLTADATTTAAIAWNAAAVDVESALTAAGISATVSGSGSVADPWVITFSVAPASVTINGAGLTQTVADASVASSATDIYKVNKGSANGGTFTLTVDAATTAPIAWNAAALDVESALTAAGVLSTVSGTGSIADPWVITFNVAPASVTIDGAGLTHPAAPSQVPVLVIVPSALPNGTLQEFQTWNQATPGGSPTPSAGRLFNAYVLRPVAANQYQVVFDSGTLTVPALANPAVSEIATFPLATPVPVIAGDVIAFYGAGIPADITAVGADIFSYPAPSAPVQGTQITIGGAEFPIYGQARTYSFGARAIDEAAALPMVDATGTAYGGVDAITVTDGGFAYTMPTVEFSLPQDPNGVTAQAHVAVQVLGDPFDGMNPDGSIRPDGIIVDDPGSGYSTAPVVTIQNGTSMDPIAGATPATASATLKIASITLNTFGSGYVSAPAVTISDAIGTGAGATATATVNSGAITGITVTNPGTGYLTVGMRKFIDNLPGLCVPPNCPTSGKYIPLAVAEKKTYNGIEADEYVIGLIQYRTSFSSDLPPTLVRGYVQLETPANAGISQHFPLQNEMLDGTFVDTGYFSVTPPQYLGPIIAATKNKPVRIVFRNLLPTGSAGDLFLPVDTSLMGSGMGPMDMGAPMVDGTVMDEARNPMCTDDPQAKDGMGMDLCFKQNRATLHLHGGITPWISDGTAHQWITPADEMATWPQGVSVEEVPDMNVCDANDDGCQTFYYTNQQSARLLFYHDHSWGITRLNVYAGEAAGYLITDDTEKTLVSSGAIPTDQIPLIIQDKTFVPDAAQLALQDPTWDTARWGTKGSFWYHHVYMPAQNPGDPGGMSAYGRWMYGPWFWPPAANTMYGPIANPYYDPACNLDDPATWQYQTDPFCEPQEIPGTPNISVGMEQFNDTPIVNGVAYPKVTLQPKSYRLRILSAANDRFFNLQWYIADPTQGNGKTEVALNPAELEAAQTDPNVFPTPVQGAATAGPDWIQIGTEGGFLPAPVVVDGQQPTTWITDPTRFDVGNVDKHSLLLAPAERADVIVDFSKFAGKTLILYNDAPAAFPARVPSYDYYTGAPDLSPNGAPKILPGYGPNTRTIMQVTIAGPAAPAFNLTRLQTAFKHNANGTGVFESGQHPIIVGQAAYNSAYGTSFAASSNCNAPGSTVQRCDGYVRVNDTMNFGFNTLSAPNVKMTMPLQPKAIHDEMNATTFDEYGRMQANLGVEAQPPTPGQQNVTLYPFVNPATEIIDGTNLPKAHVTYDANGLPVSDVKITPLADPGDGTQIWRITHNGVDTHPIHFHLYDVQVVNRVTWDNIIIPTDAAELGWKDTIRVSPLQDTIVALRPIVPEVPWELPNAIRMLNPMMPEGSTAMFNNVDPQGIPTTQIINQLVNFGWEYVYHCHILSHEEMDMMRPVTLALPPVKPTGLAATTQVVGNKLRVNLSWNDNSIAETSYLVQRTVMNSGTWSDITTIQSPLDQPNTTGVRTFADTTAQTGTAYQYRVVAKNTVGYGLEFPTMTVQSVSDAVDVEAVQAPVPPLAPTGLTGTLAFGPQVQLQWVDNSTDETGFTIQRCAGAGCTNFVDLDGVGANVTTYADNVAPNATYSYRVYAFNLAGNSVQPSNVFTVTVPAAPAAPTNLVLTVQGSLPPTGPRIRLVFRDNQNGGNPDTGFQVFRAANEGAFSLLTTLPAHVGTGNVTYFDYAITAGSTYSYYIVALNAYSPSLPSNTAITVVPPGSAAPSNFTATTQVTNNGTLARVNMTWADNSNNESRFVIQRATNAAFTANLTVFNRGANTTTFNNTGLPRGTTYYYRIRSENLFGVSAWVNLAQFPITTP
jgi:FtsP/CotA-like multicopper oxidase with cupredoxin domain